MADKRVITRMGKELERLKKEPPHGITCWPKDGRLNHLEVKLLGGESTPYEGGVFKLEIKIPNRYPFEPPHVQFLTKIYHPNIDTAGRICLDILKSPPTGSWKPAHNLHTILTSIQLLLAEPNPDDGLMADISSEFKHQKPVFLTKARKWTDLYAKGSSVPSDLTRTEESKRDGMPVCTSSTDYSSTEEAGNSTNPTDSDKSKHYRRAEGNRKRPSLDISPTETNKQPRLDTRNV